VRVLKLATQFSIERYYTAPNFVQSIRLCRILGCLVDVSGGAYQSRLYLCLPAVMGYDRRTFNLVKMQLDTAIARSCENFTLHVHC